MGYINPIIKYGIEAFCADSADAGVDGFIIPDLPADEHDIVSRYSRDLGISMIHLVAPNTSDERMRLVDSLSNGFVYCVSVTGVTGARDGKQVSDSVNLFIDRVKSNVTQNPVLVGFGIKSKEDADMISAKVDGFIVGSALIQTIGTNYPNSNWKGQVYKFVESLR
jgi:tryptophan synthase alpha chain